MDHVSRKRMARRYPKGEGRLHRLLERLSCGLMTFPTFVFWIVLLREAVEVGIRRSQSARLSESDCRASRDGAKSGAGNERTARDRAGRLRPLDGDHHHRREHHHGRGRVARASRDQRHRLDMGRRSRLHFRGRPVAGLGRCRPKPRRRCQGLAAVLAADDLHPLRIGRRNIPGPASGDGLAADPAQHASCGLLGGADVPRRDPAGVPTALRSGQPCS